MLYRVECSWSNKNGLAYYAANMAEAASIISSEIHGPKWGSARISEASDGMSAIVICPNFRPFKIIVAAVNVVKNPSKRVVIEPQKCKIRGAQPVSVTAFSITNNSVASHSKCVGFIARPKSVRLVAREITGVILPELDSVKFKKVGYIDWVEGTGDNNPAMLESLGIMSRLGVKTVLTVSENSKFWINAGFSNINDYDNRIFARSI